MKLEITAYHEAGHVAASLHFNHPFRSVTIKPEEDVLGSVYGYESSKLNAMIEYGIPSPSDERYFKHEMVILMAGGAAQAKYLKKNTFSKGCSSDFSSLVKYCEAMGIYGKALTHYSRYIIEEAKALFENNSLWNYTTTIANMLLEKQIIKYSECNNLYQLHVVETFKSLPLQSTN